ncbi:MAG: D-2-hydroxyacid dehydrogenase [Chloroflexi bacterium]|nr:D-2-hydroxyacid dehydrogenase [Chloroflexota bacterium]
MVNVLVVSKTLLHEDFINDIRRADPGVVAKDACGLFAEELRQDGVKGPLVAWLEEGVQRDLAYGIDFGTRGESLDALLSEAEVVFAMLRWPRNILSRAPGLKWLHYGGTGMEAHMDSEVFDGRITVTNARGAIAIPIAEHIMSFVFMLAKNEPRLSRAKGEKRWERFQTIELTGKTLGIVGMGAIGGELSRMAKGIGMKVIASRRSATQKEHGVGHFDEVYPRDALLEMLSESDFVALALPLTPESRQLIGEREFRAMKPTAFIVNVSRGEIIDEPALMQALKEGRISGAGLDVFENEPLPADSELWDMPNVLISPHMAGTSDRRSHHISRQFCDNLRRYLSGQPLFNIVTREKGY